ncbi:TPA: non-ribosomal peptide synthetase, partial [Escherichia coli]|nr:non-ribosomal peptide synthetase [Escherichia coli]
QVLKKVPYYSVKTHYIPTEKSDAFLVLRAQLANIVYDPEIWPLFTIQVIKTKEQPDHIFISLDNLFLDGMSMQIFFSELKTLYMEPNHQFIPLDITFRDYIDCDAYPINTQNDWEYWLTRLPQLPPAPQLPLIKDPAQIVQPRFSRLQTSLSTSVWQALQQVAQQNNVTPAALLIAAYCATLSAWSKSPELTINLTLFNRHPVHPQINEVLGDFTSLQLLDWYTCDLWSNSISMMQKRLHKDMQHRSVSAIKVMREMAIQRQMSHIEIPVVFTCALGYKHDEGFLSHHSWLKPVWGISQTPQTWLDHQVYESDGELYLNWDFVEQLFDYTTIFSMFQQYEHILTKLATEPQSWQLPLNKLIPRCNNLVITPVFNAKNNQNTHYKQSTDTQKTGQTIQKLQQLVKQVIGITLAPETNFFEAGASSLQLVQLHAALQKNGYSHITITDLFASPNLSTLAQLLWQNTSPTCEQYSDRDKHKNKRKKRLQLRTHSR